MDVVVASWLSLMSGSAQALPSFWSVFARRLRSGRWRVCDARVVIVRRLWSLEVSPVCCAPLDARNNHVSVRSWDLCPALEYTEAEPVGCGGLPWKAGYDGHPQCGGGGLGSRVRGEFAW